MYKCYRGNVNDQRTPNEKPVSRNACKGYIYCLGMLFGPVQPRELRVACNADQPPLSLPFQKRQFLLREGKINAFVRMITEPCWRDQSYRNVRELVTTRTSPRVGGAGRHYFEISPAFRFPFRVVVMSLSSRGQNPLVFEV